LARSQCERWCLWGQCLVARDISSDGILSDDNSSDVVASLVFIQAVFIVAKPIAFLLFNILFNKSRLLPFYHPSFWKIWFVCTYLSVHVQAYFYAQNISTFCIYMYVCR
jgi:hypothetical protein